MPAETIILVHGLWMTGIEMTMLRHRLQHDHGYNCVQFTYHSVTGEIQNHVSRLRQLAKEQQCERLHFIGHSLGGVVIYKMLESTSDLIEGRAVFLGSPMQGSTTVDSMSRWTLGRVAIGDAVCNELMPGQPRHWNGQRDVGIIAGSVEMGLGRLFSEKLVSDSDGTVMIEETKLDGAKDHIVLPVTHTSMVFSPLVATQIVNFLRDGIFDHAQLS